MLVRIVLALLVVFNVSFVLIRYFEYSPLGLASYLVVDLMALSFLYRKLLQFVEDDEQKVPCSLTGCCLGRRQLPGPHKSAVPRQGHTDRALPASLQIFKHLSQLLYRLGQLQEHGKHHSTYPSRSTASSSTWEATLPRKSSRACFDALAASSSPSSWPEWGSSCTASTSNKSSRR